MGVCNKVLHSGGLRSNLQRVKYDDPNISTPNE